MKSYRTFRTTRKMCAHPTIPDHALGFPTNVYIDLDSDATMKYSEGFNWVWNIRTDEPKPVGTYHRLCALVSIARSEAHIHGSVYLKFQDTLKELKRAMEQPELFDSIAKQIDDQLKVHGVDSAFYFGGTNEEVSN